MATTIQDELYRTFLKVSGQQASAFNDVTMTLTDVLAQMHEMQAVGTPSSNKTTTQPTPQGNSTGDILSSVASTVLNSGFGLAPLVTGLISLFGGGETAAPPPLIKYALPASIDFQGAQNASGVSGLDYDQAGMPRIYPANSMAATQTLGSLNANSPAAAGDPMRQASQITVNVQAMDARSFLDRSNEIALAVRDAMLNMNAINDVVNEL